eukprot:196463-Chlamydomonas_euryale.AAC.1
MPERSLRRQLGCVGLYIIIGTVHACSEHAPVDGILCNALIDGGRAGDGRLTNYAGSLSQSRSSSGQFLELSSQFFQVLPVCHCQSYGTNTDADSCKHFKL